MHGGIGRDAGKGALDGGLRDAGGARVGRHLAEEGAEIAAALRGVRREGEEQVRRRAARVRVGMAEVLACPGPGMTEGPALR